MNSGTLAVQALEKDYPNGEGGILKVIRGIDLALDPGESISVVGASGTGKSTLLHIMGALEKPSRGDVTLDGRSLFALDDHDQSRVRRKVLGFVFQFHYLLAEFSALENVSMPLRICGKTEKESRETASAVLAEVGLAGRFNHRPAQLSGGEQQRVALARALVHQPRFILADEPTGNLDRQNGRMVIDLLFGQIEKRGMGLVMVTHDESLAVLTRKCFLLEEGKLQALK